MINSLDFLGLHNVAIESKFPLLEFFKALSKEDCNINKLIGIDKIISLGQSVYVVWRRSLGCYLSRGRTAFLLG